MHILINNYFLQFDGFIDLDSYDTIALKLKGDGRCYISTVSVLFPAHVRRVGNGQSLVPAIVVGFQTFY